MILHIIDVKQYMHVGVSKPQVVGRVVEDNGMYRSNEIRCGSLAYLFDEIIRIRADKRNDILFCCDSFPEIKKELGEEIGYPYKARRPQSPGHVSYQYKAAKLLLQELGFKVIIIKGMEADDIVSSVCEKYKRKYEKIVIHTGDSDQYYLVDGKVSCIGITQRSKSVSFGNYENVLDMKYNTITMSKIYKGEPGDNIPPIPLADALRLRKVICDDVSEYLGNNRKLRTVVKSVSRNKTSIKVFDLIAPIVVLDSRISIDDSLKVDETAFSFIAKEIGCYEYQRRNVDYSGRGESLIEQIIEFSEGGE